MLRIVLLVITLALGSGAGADDVQSVLRLWGAQSGPWSGHIDIYGPGDSEPQTLELHTRWDAVPGQGNGPVTVTKIETFVGETRQTSSVTVMFAGSEAAIIETPYFVNGMQRNFRFAAVSVTVTDDTHWTTVIASPDEQEVYEGRPAVLRYVRTRSGNSVENIKEVNFLDDDGDDSFELRSFIRQTLTPVNR